MSQPFYWKHAKDVFTGAYGAPKHIVLRKTTLVTTSLGISHDDCTYYEIDVKTGFVIKLSEQNIERKSWLISQKEKTEW